MKISMQCLMQKVSNLKILPTKQFNDFLIAPL